MPISQNTKSGPVVATGGVYNSAEKSNLELKMLFNTARLNYFSEYIYEASLLKEIKIWEDNRKIKLLYKKTFTYANQKLYSIRIERISPTSVLMQIFSYNLDGSLKSIEVNS